MAGYHGYSKSNNAVAAEASGRMPLTRAAKALGLPAAFIKATYSPCEWHHSSKFYRAVDYYCVADIEEDEGKVAKLAEWRERQSSKPKPKVIDGCTVTYLIWGGTRSHPRATEVTETGCRVVDAGGTTVTVTTADGRVFRKGKTTNGFYYR